jgi:beta-galactosidase
MSRALPQMVTIFLAALLLSPARVWAAQPPSPRQRLIADSNWKFFLGDPADAEAPSFHDSDWRAVDLPHDWSIEGSPSEENPTGSGGG